MSIDGRILLNSFVFGAGAHFPLRHDDGRNDIYSQAAATKQGQGDEAQPDKSGIDVKVFSDSAAYTGDFSVGIAFAMIAS